MPPQYAGFLYADEGEVLLPAADGNASVAAPAGNDTADASRPYHGCVVGAACLVYGTVLASLPNVTSAEACCRACRQWAPPGGAAGVGSDVGTDAGGAPAQPLACVGWNWCPLDTLVPCAYTGNQSDLSTAPLAPGQCEARGEGGGLLCCCCCCCGPATRSLSGL